MRAGQLPYGDSSKPGQAVLANNLILLKTRMLRRSTHLRFADGWNALSRGQAYVGNRLPRQNRNPPPRGPTFRCIVKHREHSRPRIWAATMLAANSGSSPPYSKLRPLRGSRARLIPPANMTLKPLRRASSPIIRAATSHIQIDIATRPNSIGRRSETRRQWAMSRPNTDPDAACAP